MSQLIYFEFEFETVGKQKGTSSKGSAHNFDLGVDKMADAFHVKIGMGKDWKQTGDVAEISGTPKVAPLVVRKKLDANTPILHDALGKNDLLKTASFHFFKDVNGSNTNYFTITITKGRLISQDVVLPEAQHADDMELQAYEELKFTYGTLTYDNKKVEGLETEEEQAATTSTFDTAS